MTKLKQIYKCAICGNMVEVIHEAGGELSCCGQAMTLMTENTVDASKEKHIPVIEKTATGFLVKIGSIPHPMEEKHFIEWIELIADEKVYRKHLKPGDKPEAEFLLPVNAFKVEAREYCNLHGLWKAII
jgi:superoxide reductase